MQKSRYMLEKHGWSDGKGLGRHEHGRSKRLVIRRHTTTKGVGVDNEKWGDNWWQYAYNRALSHAGEEGEDAVSLMIRTRHDRSAALQSVDGDDAKKALLYGMFVKPKRKCDHFLSNEMAAESPDSPAKTTVNGASSSSEEEDTDDFRSQRASFGNVLTDEQLFLFCGKRTKRYSAHGKLKRVMEQDLLLSASKVQASDLMGSNSKSVGGVKVPDDTDKARKIVTEEKSERKRKRKRQDTGEDTSEPEKKDKKRKEKRKKKKRKTKSELSADEVDDSFEGEGSVVSVKKEKRKKRAIEPSSDEETSRKRRKHRESDVMDVEENGNVSEDKTTGKKKKEKKEKKKKEEKKKDKKKEKKKKKDKKKESEEKNDSRRPAMWEEEEEKEVKIESKRHEAVHKSSDMEACKPGMKRQRCVEEYDDAEERSHRKRRKRK